MIVTPYRTGDEEGHKFKEAVDFHTAGQAWSVWDDIDLVAIIGGAKMWGSVCVVYAHVSHDAQSKQALGLIRACAKCLAELADSGQFNKFQAFIDASQPTNIKFIKSLGFHKEGLMTIGMPNGSDCAIYGRIV